jgi:hypothetical protein
LDALPIACQYHLVNGFRYEVIQACDQRGAAWGSKNTIDLGAWYADFTDAVSFELAYRFVGHPPGDSHRRYAQYVGCRFGGDFKV